MFCREQNRHLLSRGSARTMILKMALKKGGISGQHVRTQNAPWASFFTRRKSLHRTTMFLKCFELYREELLWKQRNTNNTTMTGKRHKKPFLLSLSWVSSFYRAAHTESPDIYSHLHCLHWSNFCWPFFTLDKMTNQSNFSISGFF